MTQRHTVRLYLDAKLADGQSLSLDRAQAHYLLNVMRLNDGACISVFNNQDGQWQASVQLSGKHTASLRIQGQSQAAHRPPDLWLIFAPIKKSRTDFIVEKATELGVRAIFPILTALSNTRRINQARLQAHAIEAAEQCGGVFVPKLHGIQTLSALLADWPAERRLFFCDEEGRAAGTSEAMGQAALSSMSAQPKAAILIGPEGGFSAKERTWLYSLAFVRALSLGPRILRADTAAVAALSLWQAHCGDWRR